MSKLTIQGYESLRLSHMNVVQEVEMFAEIYPMVHSVLVKFIGNRVKVVVVQTEIPCDDRLSELLCDFEVNLTCSPMLNELSIDTISIPRVSDEARDQFASAMY